MTWARMSNLPKQLSCPGQSTLAALVSSDKGLSAKEAAEYGTAAHLYKEGKPTNYPWSFHDKMFIDRLPAQYPAGGRHEVHVGWNPELEVAHLYSSLEEKEQAQDPVITGTIDWMTYNNKGYAALNDLKTGELRVDLDDPQLLGYATWLAGWAGTDEVTVSVLHWPRKGWWRDLYMKKHGVPFEWYERVVDYQELLDFKEKLLTAYYDWRTGVTNPGAHCVFCPASTICPEWQAKGKRYDRD